MAFNLTGVNVDLYFAVNAGIHAAIFAFTALPALILCLLCVIALFFADEVIWPMRVLIINIFIAENVYWVAQLALYSIKVYIFIQYGTKRVKWAVIVPYIIISYLVAIVVGGVPIFGRQSVTIDNGFCISDQNTFVQAFVAVAVFMIFILLTITIIFSFLTFCYVKKTVLRENVDIKKAVARNLYYFTIASFFALVYSIAPAASSPIKLALSDKGVIPTTIVNYIFQVLISLPSAASPVVAIAILKPLRLALKQGITKCCRRRAE